MTITWEKDPLYAYGKRAVTRVGDKVFRTAALEALTPNQRRQWEFILQDEVNRFLAGRKHNFVQHSPFGEPNVYTRPGML